MTPLERYLEDAEAAIEAARFALADEYERGVRMAVVELHQKAAQADELVRGW